MKKSHLYEEVSNALAMARINLNLTQGDVAARLKRPQSYVSKYESGERRLDVVEFLQVCKALKINAGDLLNKIANQLK